MNSPNEFIYLMPHCRPLHKGPGAAPGPAALPRDPGPAVRVLQLEAGQASVGGVRLPTASHGAGGLRRWGHGRARGPRHQEASGLQLAGLVQPDVALQADKGAAARPPLHLMATYPKGLVLERATSLQVASGAGQTLASPSTGAGQGCGWGAAPVRASAGARQQACLCHPQVKVRVGICLCPPS